MRNQIPQGDALDALVERIVGEVIRRLRAMDRGEPAGAAPVPRVLDERLITVATLERLPPGSGEVLIPSKAIVTPLARDEANARGMRLTRRAETDDHEAAGQ